MLQVPDLACNDGSIGSGVHLQCGMGCKEERHDGVDGEEEDERLPRLPDVWPHMVPHSVALARARGADVLRRLRASQLFVFRKQLPDNNLLDAHQWCIKRWVKHRIEN